MCVCVYVCVLRHSPSPVEKRSSAMPTDSAEPVHFGSTCEAGKERKRIHASDDALKALSAWSCHTHPAIHPSTKPSSPWAPPQTTTSPLTKTPLICTTRPRSPPHPPRASFLVSRSNSLRPSMSRTLPPTPCPFFLAHSSLSIPSRKPPRIQKRGKPQESRLVYLTENGTTS